MVVCQSLGDAISWRIPRDILEPRHETVFNASWNLCSRAVVGHGIGATELPDTPPATSAAKDKEQVSRLLLQYRKNRNNPKGQVEPVWPWPKLAPTP